MTKKHRGRIAGIMLIAFLLPGIVTVFSSTTAQAQQRRIIVVRRPIYRVYRPWGRGFSRPWGWDRWGYDPSFDYYSRYGHYVFNNSEKAFDQGYRDGMKTGQGDAKNRRTYNPQRSHYYQEAGFGNFGEVYRSGFLRGYADGFRS